jgi:WD40 repeat protein
MTRRHLAVAVLTVVALAAATAALAKTQVFLETSEAEFAQGHADGIVWTSQGTLRLGRAVESLLPATEGVDYVARLAEGPDGSIYAVTGGSGRIYRIKDGKASVFATLTDKFLFSCAVDKGGDLYVGSGGAKGRIWRVQPQARGEPKAEVFFEADDVKYVWDLAWMKDGALAAATGDKGKLFRIAPDKKSTVLLKSEADHILCLAVAPDGTLYAGTDGPAIVYRWDGKRAFVVYDADEAEVTALALDAAGNLFAAASSGTGGRAGGTEMPSAASVRIPISSSPPLPRGELKEGAARSSGGAATTGASVYRVAPDGIVTRIFEGHEAMILSLAVAQERLLIGTGKNARVYETGCGADDEEACVASIDPKQVMALLATRDGRVIVGAAGRGRVYALSKGHAREGAYTSQAYDAGGSARWGALDWRGRTPDGTEIRIATRTGNVRDPEKGMWSEWSKDATKPGAKIESPPARFIQFRVTMRGRGDATTPVLEQYEGAYQRVNEAPRVLSVGEKAPQDSAARAQALDRFRQALKPPARTSGPGSPQPPSAPPPPPPEGPQPVRIIQWQAVDPNGDSLRYDVYMRGQGEPTWILLDKNLTQPQYAWDTATVADGWYEIKVVASDRADNPEGTALEGFKISDPILVDNTAPVVENLRVQVKAGGDAEVTFAARDATSRLTSAAYTLDSADQWRPLTATDDLFDGRQKEFRFTVKNLSPGPHRLAVRAVDEAQNIGHAASGVQIGKYPRNCSPRPRFTGEVVCQSW